MSSLSPSPYGMRFSDQVPKWIVEPDTSTLKSIAMKHLVLSKEDQCDIEFLAEGSFNKVYKIITNRAFQYVIRVALPLDVPLKVESEIATMRLISEATNLPLPKVIAYDPTCDNELLFPWIIMEYVDGRRARDAWFTMSDDKRHKFVVDLALYNTQLVKLEFDKMGSLMENEADHSLGSPENSVLASSYTETVRSPDSPSKSATTTIGPILTINFIHAMRSICKGPYSNSQDWIRARTQFILEYYQSIEDPSIAVRNSIIFIESLLESIPSLCPYEKEAETFVFHAGDMDSGNILVNDEDEIIALLDWEYTYSCPKWLATKLPSVLTDHYVPTWGEEEPPLDYEEDWVDWNIRDKYRPIFVAEMEKLNPGWIELHRSTEKKRELVQVLDELMQMTFGDEWDIEWLEKIKKGEDTSKIRDPAVEF